MVDIIVKKRDGKILTKEEISFFVKGYVNGSIPDYQVSALAMAIVFRGMSKEEITVLTELMMHSGDIIDLSSIKGVKADKHSTGGVGDKTSLVLGPMVAACGVKVAKMSGRGLGHTGGTLDKMEAIPGMKIAIPEAQFMRQVNEVGLAIVGQTGHLVPADKKLYSLRDVTGTVESIPLIASSVMSKKLASGSDTILLDVKFGSGAFMKDLASARELARTMVDIGDGLNRDTRAILTDMEQPLGLAVGNALEVKEAIATLHGKGPRDLIELCLEAGSIMLEQAKVVDDLKKGRKLLEKARESGVKVKAVITVDLAGHPCDMQAFAALKREFGFFWIQDACHSIGASWEDNLGIRWKVGEWPEVDLTVYSFHPVKHITTGEGGMITTHSQEMADKMRLFRTHGITRKPGEFMLTDESHDADGSVNPWYYEMQELGFNYRLTDIQAALGTSQLKRLAAGIFRRQQIVAAYQIRFAADPFIKFPEVAEGVSHAYHLAVVMIDFDAAGKTRAQVMNFLKQKNIGSQVHYMPVPMMPYYRNDCDLRTVPVAVAYYRQALSLPCFPQMTDEDIDRVCSALKEAIR